MVAAVRGRQSFGLRARVAAGDVPALGRRDLVAHVLGPAVDEADGPQARVAVDAAVGPFEGAVALALREGSRPARRRGVPMTGLMRRRGGRFGRLPEWLPSSRGWGVTRVRQGERVGPPAVRRGPRSRRRRPTHHAQDPRRARTGSQPGWRAHRGDRCRAASVQSSVRPSSSA